MFDRWGFRLQSPEGGEGAGGSGAPKGTDVLDRAKRVLDRNKRALDAVTLVLREKDALQEELRKAREEGSVPKGAVVLQGDDAKLWEKVKGAGKPEDVERMLKEHPELAKYKAETEQTSATRNVARAMGWEPDVLVDITNARGLEYEDREITVRDAASGKEEKKRVPHVRSRGVKDAKFEPLTEFAARELKAYERALKAKPNGTGSSTSVPFPAQPSTDQGSGITDMTEKFIAREYPAPKNDPAK